MPRSPSTRKSLSAAWERLFRFGANRACCRPAAEPTSSCCSAEAAKSLDFHVKDYFHDCPWGPWLLGERRPPAERFRMTRRLAAFAPALVFVAPGGARAAEELSGAEMGWPWALPFIAVLLSIATGPLLYPKLWHHHYGKVVGAWAVATLLALALVYGVPASLSAFVHTILAEYLSFILLLLVLYTVAGGILVTGNVHGTPRTNTLMLAVG